MQISGPTQIVFPNGSAQQPLALSATGFSGTVQYTITAVPSQIVSIRKTASSAPLVLGNVLTAAEAANLVATRTATGGGTITTRDQAAATAVKYRFFNTGAAASAFVTGTQTEIDAFKNSNFWVPNYPPAGTGTTTIDVLIDLGSASVLTNLNSLPIQFNYGGSPDQWSGVSARAIVSTDGTSVTVLDALTITGSASPNTTRTLSGAIAGAPSARWVGVRLLGAPKAYPCILQGMSFQTSSGATSFTPLQTPVTFGVRGTDSGSTGGQIISQSGVIGVKYRFYNSGSTAPALTTGTQTQINAIKDSNFWVPNYPPSGTGTTTVDLLFDVGTPIVLSNLNNLPMQLNYGGSPNQWAGITAQAIISSNGTSVTVLNQLNITASASNSNVERAISGPVSGATSARWVGVRLLNVPKVYPFIVQGLSVQSAGGASASADYSVAIGDTTTNFGTTPPVTGAVTIYGDPGTRFPLGITVPAPAASYALTVPAGLTLEVRTEVQGTTAVASSYTLNNANGPFAPVQTGVGASTVNVSAYGTGKTFDGTYLNLPQNTYVESESLGLAYALSADASKSQTPKSITLNYVGIIPTDAKTLAAVAVYLDGGIILRGNWATNNLLVTLERDGVTEELASATGISNTAEENVSVRWTDNASGPGGTLTFFRGATQLGTPITTTLKPRITPAAKLQCNALSGNGAAGSNIKVKRIGVGTDLPTTSFAYTPISSGTITAAQLQQLSVDARAVTLSQAAKTVTYQPSGGTAQSLNVVIGPLVVPAGAAFRAVLENWSTGSAVNHPNALVMTKATRQNCRFEDIDLYGSQTAWTECIPQGPVPVIGGIAYRCEAIRCGTYVQFQFGYDWDASVMPANPFGDPSGLESYMVPHKWRIEDSAGNLITRIQRPDGGPLNGTDIPRIFSGSYDGRNCAITNATNKWYPHGTVRSGIIWRSGNPPAYAQTVISAKLPRYDVTVPYAMHTDFSNNGFDLRIFTGASGGDGNANGFGNTRVMPYEPTNYATLTAQVGVTQDPYKASLYSANSLAAVASTWLKYTPFNQSGRSPTTGPGGVRDDRAVIAEPVVQYMYNTAASRPHDGKAFAIIALDYLTGYVSDPYHCYEAGRCVPLFKGINASRTATLRNHYYGYGEASTPPSRAYYVQSGRLSDVVDGLQPLQVKVPSKGIAANKPCFGTNAIDAAHAHQFPHWGSLLWQTPEFAFLGHKFWDQTRLYNNFIIGESDATRWSDRDGAWAFLHAVMAWKTASSNSDRLYSRSEVLAYAVRDFETFSDLHLTGPVSFNSPPTNVLTSGAIDSKKAIYAAAQYFGPVMQLDANGTIGQHDFMIGYWLSALGIAEKLGFNAALRAASTKAGNVLTWMIAQHRKRIIGRINEAPLATPFDEDGFLFNLWSSSSIIAAGGNVAALPQTYSAVAAINGSTATWDLRIFQGAVRPRDGQALDQLLAAPSVLKNQLGQTGSNIDAAITNANSRRDQKKNEQVALGINAGDSWFRFLNAVNNPALS
jgi:hypothetical protein